MLQVRKSVKIGKMFTYKISVNISDNVNRTANLTGPPPCMDPPLEVSEEYLVRSGISFLIFCAAIVGNIFVLYPLIRNFKRQRFSPSSVPNIDVTVLKVVKRMPVYSYIINLCASNLFFCIFVMFQDAIWHITVQW